jgi:spore cortex formation protein SpoVR/YcgB (stage V sporulation)
MEMKKKGFIRPNSGFQYIDQNGRDMVELHMDTCHIFEERANDETKFGGNLSARKKQEKKPLIMWT